MTIKLNAKNIHGCAIVLGHHGLLIRGPSGSGKTTLCHRLIDQWLSSDQFATWVGDDQVLCEVLNTKHIVTATLEIGGLTERRFSGISKTDHQESAVLDLEICLIPHSQLERLPEAKTSTQHINLASIDVPERDSELAMELIIEHLNSI